MQKEISELLKYRRWLREQPFKPPKKAGRLTSFFWLWHNYPLELRKYARKYSNGWEA